MMNLTTRSLQEEDSKDLLSFLLHLSEETKSRFGPHPFDEPTVQSICRGHYEKCLAFGAFQNNELIGYVIVKTGIVPHESPRLSKYGLATSENADFTLAPAITDEYQSSGIGSRLYQFVENELIKLGGKRIFLWGGVQASNERAIRFYEKNGFTKLGEFEYHGMNIDMAKYIS